MDDAATHELPDDVAALKAMCATLRMRLVEHDAVIAQRDAALSHHEATISAMRHEILVLRKKLYGPRADRLQSDADLAQMLLEFATQLETRSVHADDLASDTSSRAGEPNGEPRRVDAAQAGHDRRRGGRRRIADLDQLPVTTVEHDLSDSEKACPGCGTCRKRIGSEESWQVEYIPGHFERFHHIRHTYACSACDANGDGGQIETAPKPCGTSPIEKGLPGPGLLAYVVTSKFADYLPLYRLENIFTRNGLAIARSTLSVWCRDVAEIAMPLYELMCSRVRQSRVVATDDTVMPMQAKVKTKQARLWVYVGDDANPYNVFDFTPNRSRDGPTRFLREFRATLLADAYGGYDGVVTGNGMTRAGCWAHARRKFVDAEKSEPRIAAEAVALIDGLFDVERSCRDADCTVRLVVRERESRPLLATLRARLLRWKSELLPKHAMAGAVQYVLNQWEELNVFAHDGEVPIDNNVSEREMKRLALNRKNSLFVGNPRGGETAAILSSLTSSCRRHEIDPQRYLTQLLVNLPATPSSQLGDWLPDAWKARQSETA